MATRYMDTRNVNDMERRYCVNSNERRGTIPLRVPQPIEVIPVTFKAPLDLTVHAPDGMYDPANEHDACGVGMVTTLNKRPERKIVD